VLTRSLRNTWIAVAIASLAVIISGGFIIKNFLHHVFVDCKGTLQSVDPSELSDNSRRDDSFAFRNSQEKKSDLEVRYDTIDADKHKNYTATHYKNIRIVWNRDSDGAGVTCACKDIPLKWEPRSDYYSPSSLRIHRDDVTGLYVVRDPQSSKDLAVFRKIDNKGRRFQSDKLLEGNNVPLAVFLLALGSLAIAAFRLISASPYARYMHAWRPATLRNDGVVEGESGATLGMMENRSRIPAGKVIVDPAALEGRDIYREMPILTKKQVGAGSHERWTEGTARRLRDARSLAIIASMATGLSLVASILGS
jgi:hypothetical protein